MREIFEHLLELATTPWGPIVLTVHGYLESFIFPGPHDIFLISLCLATPKLSFLFALISTTASVCGILTGYAIGRFSEKNIVERIFHSDKIKTAKYYIQKYDVWAIAVACFTPLPVKVFSYLAGAAGINLKRLIFVAFLARGARFFLIAGVLFFIGEPAKEFLLHYTNYAMIALFVLMTIFFIVGQFGDKKKKSANSSGESQDPVQT